MVPRIGPVLFALAQGTNVPNGSATAAIRFRWPRALFCTGLQVVTRSGLVSDLSLLSVRIQDESFQDMAYDGRGGVSVPLGLLPGPDGVGGPGLLVPGGNGWLVLQRPVLDGDLWFFTVANAGGADIVLAGLFLRFEEGLRRAS